AMSDQKSFLIQPNDVACFGGSRTTDLAQQRNPQTTAAFSVTPCFSSPVGFAGIHRNQPVVSGKRSVVGIDGVERKVGGSRQLHNLSPRGGQLAAQFGVLGLGNGYIRAMVEA